MSKYGRAKRKHKRQYLAIDRSERDALVLSAYEAYSLAHKSMGLSALDAFRDFVERLDNKQAKGEKRLTAHEAREILSDPTKFAETLVEADRLYQEHQQAKLRSMENKDIAIIKKSVALKATLWVAATFCVISPFVSEIEKPALDWAKEAIVTQYKHAKEAYEHWSKTNVVPTPPAAKDKKGPAAVVPKPKTPLP